MFHVGSHTPFASEHRHVQTHTPGLRAARDTGLAGSHGALVSQVGRPQPVGARAQSRPAWGAVRPLARPSGSPPETSPKPKPPAYGPPGAPNPKPSPDADCKRRRPPRRPNGGAGFGRQSGKPRCACLSTPAANQTGPTPSNPNPSFRKQPDNGANRSVLTSSPNAARASAWRDLQTTPGHAVVVVLTPRQVGAQGYIGLGLRRPAKRRLTGPGPPFGNVRRAAMRTWVHRVAWSARSAANETFVTPESAQASPGPPRECSLPSLAVRCNQSGFVYSELVENSSQNPRQIYAFCVVKT